MFILCHKCRGVLQHTDDDAENAKHLSWCVCISGWVRGFEPHLDFRAAAAKQIEAADDRIKLYARQGRPMSPGSSEHQHIERLKLALYGEVPCSVVHGHTGEGPCPECARQTAEAIRGF